MSTTCRLRRGPRHRRLCFTLIELLVVIAIISPLTSMLTPMRDERLRQRLAEDWDLDPETENR